MDLTTLCQNAIYVDLPPFIRSADWHSAGGRDVKVVIPYSIWDRLLSDASKCGSQREAGFVLVGYQPRFPLRALITDFEPIGQGSETAIRAGREFLDGALRAMGRYNNVEQFLGLPPDKKVIVGGAHTHPGHGVFLSATDRESMEQFRAYAKKHPELYALTDGNFEIVIDPSKKDSVDGFKLTPSGYEPVDMYVVRSLENCFAELRR